MPTRALIVDDDAAMCSMLQARLSTRGLAVETCSSPLDVVDMVQARDFDVVVTDLNMKGLNGVDLCRSLVEARPNLPVILITAFGTMDTAIGAIRAGAYDFLPKPFELDQLVLAIDRGVTLSRLKDEVQRLHLAVGSATRFGEIIGESPPMRELFELLARIVDADAPVLVTGESGTGKELVARALHDRSSRATGPFVALNCAAMPPQLLESELFGYAKGAFTDAKETKQGLFLAANGGTLFLDEIGEMPLELQPKLLRALQERTVRAVGSNAEVPFDARVITATNRDLETMVEERRFREDLFFRVNVIQLAVPPLRTRGADVLLLANTFLQQCAARVDKRIIGFAPEAAERILAYPWPGNVRELHNCVERAVALASFDKITVKDLPDRVRANRGGAPNAVAEEEAVDFVSLDELERRYVLRVLASFSGNKSAAARVLRIERKTLYRMLERWGPAAPSGSASGSVSTRGATS